MTVSKAARFKYSDANMNDKESTPGPGSYDTIPARDLQSSNSKGKLSIKKPIIGLSKDASREELHDTKSSIEPLDSSVVQNDLSPYRSLDKEESKGLRPRERSIGHKFG